MDREQIIKVVKSLECCLACDGCPIQNECENNPFDATLARHSLLLINEFIEENRMLRESKESECDHCACVLLDQRDEVKALLQKVKVDIVRKIQEDMAMHFGTYTDKDEVKVLDVIRLVNRIGEEMLGESDIE